MAFDKIGIYNDIPEDQVRKLPAEGNILKFRYLHKEINPVNKRPVWPAAVQIPGVARVKNKKGEWHRMAHIDGVDGNGKPVPKQGPVFHLGNSGGELRFLVGKDTETDEIAQLLLYSPYVKGFTPEEEAQRDQSVIPLFERVDDDQEADKRREERSSRIAALARTASIAGDEAKVLQAAMVLGLPIGSNTVMLDAVEAYAEKRPADFLKKVDDPDAAIIAVVKQALQSGKLIIDSENHELKNAAGTKVTTLGYTNGDEAIIEIVSFFKEPTSKKALVSLQADLK